MRGEFIFLPAEDALLFMGSPWSTDASEIAERGLGFEDFAIHDPVVDMLRVLRRARWPWLARRNWPQSRSPTHEQALRLSRLFDDLLDLSSLQSGRTKFNDEPLSLQHIAQACLIEIAPLAGAKAQRIEPCLTDGLPAFRGDPVRLQSVITNLLSKAVNFTPVGGTIRLTLNMKDGFFHLAVEDNGPGIPADQHDLIFEKFHRVYHRGSSTFGTGLGLPIVKAIVDHYGGRIEIEGKVDQGSSFRIFLPAQVNLGTTVLR